MKGWSVVEPGGCSGHLRWAGGGETAVWMSTLTIHSTHPHDWVPPIIIQHIKTIMKKITHCTDWHVQNKKIIYKPFYIFLNLFIWIFSLFKALRYPYKPLLQDVIWALHLLCEPLTLQLQTSWQCATVSICFRSTHLLLIKTELCLKSLTMAWAKCTQWSNSYLQRHVKSVDTNCTAVYFIDTY